MSQYRLLFIEDNLQSMGMKILLEAAGFEIVWPLETVDRENLRQAILDILSDESEHFDVIIQDQKLLDSGHLYDEDYKVHDLIEARKQRFPALCWFIVSGSDPRPKDSEYSIDRTFHKLTAHPDEIIAALLDCVGK